MLQGSGLCVVNRLPMRSTSAQSKSYLGYMQLKGRNQGHVKALEELSGGKTLGTQKEKGEKKVMRWRGGGSRRGGGSKETPRNTQQEPGRFCSLKNS